MGFNWRAKMREAKPYLAKEMVSNILIWLPGSAVVRCRCVCKEWRNIIAQPSFVKAHCQTQIQNQNNHRLLIASSSSQDGLHCSVRCSQTAIQEYFTYHAHHDDIPISIIGKTKTITKTGSHLDDFRLVGSCNGLVCAATFASPSPLYGTPYLFNPLTRQWWLLPAHHETSSDLVFGFGFDESTDDYKVVKISHIFSDDDDDEDEDGVSSSVNISVYSQRNNCWRRVSSGVPLCFWEGISAVSLSGAVSLKGALHWLVSEGSWADGEISVIICFNLATEKMSVFKLADAMETKIHRVQMITTLQGCIAVITEDEDEGRERQVWVMKEYGNADSWTRLYVFESGDNVVLRDMWPLGITANAQLLLTTNFILNSPPHHIFSHDSITKQVVGLMDSLHPVDMVPYVETLVSV